MPLTILNCSQNPRIPDLAPLKGMRLTDLSCNDTKVSDLSPLKGMPLTKLYFDATKISDLSPLAGMKLSDVSFTPGQIRVGMDVLRRMPSVQTLRITPFEPAESPAEFWKNFDAGAFKK
jgi:Leucine-rich repeat (LRR) protein